jgi:hypothetical protein
MFAFRRIVYFEIIFRILGQPGLTNNTRKVTLFLPCVLILSPKEIDKKNNYKKVFLSICTGSKTLFVDIKIFEKVSWKHLVSGTSSKNLK